MDYTLYLERIQFNDEPTPTLDTLRKLHRHHYFHVPFENLDIHSGRKIVLNPEHLYNKIVKEKRGGFCYELNGMFYELLRHLGFEVRMISARVYSSRKQAFGADYDHMALIVTINGEEWLADVGFGEFLAEPLKIEMDRLQQDERAGYRIEKYEDDYLLVTQFKNDMERMQYIFKPIAKPLEAFEEMCHFHQTSPASHFTLNKICSLPIEDGRISLTDDALKIGRCGEDTQEFPMVDQQAYEQALKKYFGFEPGFEPINISA